MSQIHSTTILAIRHDAGVVFAGDGQVTLGNTIMKHTANKLRKLGDGLVLAGFAGSAADAFTLYERFEAKFKEWNGQLTRAAVELAKDWRADKYLRQLDAVLAVGNLEHLYLLSGSGDVIEPDDGLLGIGSGGNYALAAARALMRQQNPPSPREVAFSAMTIAAEICPFTNQNIVIEEIAG